FSAGGEVEAFEMTPEIEWLATQTSRILNLDLAGIDLLFDHDHFKVCEANSSPGFKGLEKVCDVNIPKEIFHYLRIRLGRFSSPQPTRTVLDPVSMALADEEEVIHLT
ncbi:MAG: ATP-grasp domain-containing protein, partial [Synechocystis sp.]